MFQFCSVQLLNVSQSATPWTAAHQASLSIANSWSLLKLMYITLVMRSISSSVVPFSRLQSFPASGSFPMSRFFASRGQSIGASTSASVLPMNKYSGLIPFRIDWLDLLAVQGIYLKNLNWPHKPQLLILYQYNSGVKGT